MFLNRQRLSRRFGFVSDTDLLGDVFDHRCQRLGDGGVLRFVEIGFSVAAVGIDPHGQVYRYLTQQRQGGLLGRFACAAPAEDVVLGPAGGMDSLTLVEFVLAIEETLANEFDRNVAVAPMERIDTSETGPFRTVGSLVAHVATLLEEEESAA